MRKLEEPEASQAKAEIEALDHLADDQEPVILEIPLASCLILNQDRKAEVKNCRSIIIEDECPSLAVQSPNYQLAVMNLSCAEILKLKSELTGACIVMNGDEFQCESARSSYQCAQTLADSKGLYGYFLMNQNCEEPITHTL